MSDFPAESIMLRKACRHNLTHAHSYYGFYNDLDGQTQADDRWCTQGDYYVYTPDELRARIAATLANQDPRVPIADVDAKAEQIVENLFAPLRDGTVVSR